MTEAARVIGEQAAAPLGRSPYRVQVLDRIFNILNALAEANESLGPAELAARLSLHKSTVHRLLMVLERHRFVRRNPSQGKYSLGIKLFELGSRAVAQFDLRDRAEPFLRRLVNQTEETAHVCILDGFEMVSIANVEGPWTMRTPSTVGRRTPAYCTSVGKAVIAFLQDDALDEFIEGVTFKQYTRKTLATRAALKAELMRVRERGFAIDDEEIERGLRCVGAPIRNHTGRIVASIGIAGPACRLTNQRLPVMVRAVTAAARELSADLGYSIQKGRQPKGRKRPGLGDV
jgi:DNA-binding IclR family transcriptional regulator